MSTALHAVFFPLLIVVGLFGLLAVLKPSLFREFVTDSSLHTPVDIGRYILPHSRLFGAVILSTVAACWFRLF